jgi:4-amino-4-deoxy-L-arabinose transferase-like glycosyltransferase
MNLRNILRSNFLLLSLLTLVGAILLLTTAYSLKSSFRVSVGEFGDSAFIEKFNSDEAGAIRYRWSSGNSSVILPLAPNNNASNKLSVELGAALAKDSKAQTPPIVTVLANGVEVGKAQTVEGEVKAFDFDLPQAALTGDNLKVTLNSPTFRASGDPRTLGVKVQAVNWQTGATLRFPPLEVLIWAWLFLLSFGLVLSSRAEARSYSVIKYFLVCLGLPVLIFLPILILPYVVPRNVNLWYSSVLLWLAALLAVLIAALVWRDKLSGWLWDFPARLEEGKLARNILIAVTIVYMVYSFSIIIRMDFVGHADYADNAVAARNMVRGNGYALDYAAQFYRFTPLPRPADTWPPLQPWITAPFFAVFGSSAFAAKLPNWILISVLTWAIFYYGSRYFNRKTGLAAALLILASPMFFETVAYPINDLGFTLWAFLSFMAVYSAANFRPITGAAVTEDTLSRAETRYTRSQKWLSLIKSFLIRHRLWLIAGVWGGLLILNKPSGAILLVAIGLWLLWHKFFRKNLYLPWASLIMWGVVVLLVASPYFIRNQLQFGFPIYTTERYDAWLLKWYPPDERIYDLYYPINKPLPNEKDILIYGFDTAFKAINLQFTKLFNDMFNGRMIEPLVLILGAVGLIGLRRKRYGLIAMLVFAFVLYVLFINVYWHYEVRYFLMWLPVFYLFGMYGLSWLYDKARDNATDKIGRLGGWLVAGAFLLLILPGIPQITNPNYISPTGIVTTSNWINQNLPKEAVIMSRTPWQVSFHADRKTVMFPNSITNLDQLSRVLSDYKVTHFQFSHTNLRSNDPDEPFWGQRTALWDLIRKKEVPGFKLLYDKDGFYVYEIVKP